MTEIETSGSNSVKANIISESIALGCITLAAVVLLGAKVYLGLSAGGMERMIAYPLLIWVLGTGAYLMAPEQG